MSTRVCGAGGIASSPGGSSGHSDWAMAKMLGAASLLTVDSGLTAAELAVPLWAILARRAGRQAGCWSQVRQPPGEAQNRDHDRGPGAPETILVCRGAAEAAKNSPVATAREGKMDAIDNQRVAKILRDGRRMKGVTQEWVVEATGLSIQTVKRAEGRGMIGEESLRAICSVLGLVTEEVLQRARRSAGASCPLDRYAPLPRYASKKPPCHEIAWLLSFLVAVLISGFVSGWLWGRVPAGDSGLTAQHLVDVVNEASDWSTKIAGLFGIPSLILVLMERRVPPFPKSVWLMHAVGMLFLGLSNMPIIMVTAFAGFADAGMVLGVGLLASIAQAFVGIAIIVGNLGRNAKAYRRAREDFVARLPLIIGDMRAAVCSRDEGDRLEWLATLLREAQFLARHANRPGDVCALQHLVEDVDRGVSGRVGLLDYLVLAERMCGAEPLRGRLAEDATDLLRDLRRRVSAFA